MNGARGGISCPTLAHRSVVRHYLPMPIAIRKRPARIAYVGVAASLVAISVSAAPSVLATEVTIDTFPSTGVVLPLVADPSLSPQIIGQGVVVPNGSPVLTQFSFEFAAVTSSITVQAVVLPFDVTTSSNTGEPIFTSEPVTVTNTTLARITFATGNLSLAPGGTYLIGLTTVYQTQTTTNQGQFGLSPGARYPQGTSWQVVTGGLTNLAAGKTFTAASVGNGLTLSATFTSNAASGQAPPGWLQQVGVPNSGECTAINDADLNRGGVSSGGWGKSWAQWVNDGRGGAVCTRTLVYSTAQSRWVVG